ncbi:MAG: hypothetical protein IT210_17420 [Armatimonadetes bacterium]|nr:hypothetical protein [Armatimonadota bacterium]
MKLLSKVIKAGQQPRYARLTDVLGDVRVLATEAVPGGMDGAESASSLQIAKALEEERILMRQELEARIMEEIRQEAESIRRTAREEGLQEGYRAGSDQGYREAADRCESAQEAYLSSLRSDIEAFIGSILSERERILAETEPEVIRLVLEIARKVLRDESAANPELVMGVVGHALRRVTNKERIRVRVNIADLSHVKERREQIIALLDGIEHLEILDDQRIGPGGCLVETDSGNIDARLETQLEQIERTLLEA